MKQEILAALKTRKKGVAIAIGALGILLLFLSELAGGGAAAKPKNEPQTETDAAAAAQRMEEKLAQLLSSIDGAGNAEVMISLDSAGEAHYAADLDADSVVNERTTEYSEKRKYVLTDDGGIRLKTSEPQIRGVAVVCEGAGDPFVKREITETVRAALGVSRDKIYVAEMKNNGGKR